MTIERLENGAQLIDFSAGGTERRFAIATNFIVEWVNPDAGEVSIESETEMLVILPKGGTIITGTERFVADAVSVGIIPPGCFSVETFKTAAIILATDRPDLDSQNAINAGQPKDKRVAPITAFARPEPLVEPLLLALDSIPVPPDNGRVRFLQSATMSINIVVYSGPRDNTALSPHSHEDIEQGTLAITGNYIHHLRRPWSRNVKEWLADVHLDAGSETLLLIPPELIHTTEGVMANDHFMLDIFAPPRRDFIAKNWMSNANDYLPPNDPA